MDLSRNVLIIESLSVIPEDNIGIMSLKGEMKSEIHCLCPNTYNHFRTYVIISEGKGYSQDEAIKNSIQNFIDGRVCVNTKHYNKAIECVADTKNIHVLDIQVQEPYKSLFLQLFRDANWQMPKELQHSKFN